MHVVAAKKDRTGRRFCIDYRPLNDGIFSTEQSITAAIVGATALSR